MKQLVRIIALTLTICSAISCSWLGEETFAHSHFSRTKDHTITFVSENTDAQTIAETESETDAHASFSHVVLNTSSETITYASETVCRFFEFKSVTRLPAVNTFGRFFNLPPPRV